MPQAAKHLLIAAYYFPPMGLGGVQRASKLAKYLARAGWKVSVLCADYRGYPALDLSLLEELPEEIHVKRVKDPWIRTKARPDANPTYRPQQPTFLRRLVRLPDARRFWSAAAAGVARRLVRAEAITHVLTTSPPPSVHWIGLHLKAMSNLKWVADFRDVWFNDQLPPLTPVHAWVRKRLEKRIIQNADAVAVVSPAHQRQLRQNYPQFESKLHFIPNGFDAEDFPDTVEQVTVRMVLAHCGTLSNARAVDRFLRVLNDLARRLSGVRTKVCFLQIGVVEPSVQEVLQRRGLDSVAIETCGYLPHSQALEKLATCTAAVVFCGAESTIQSAIPGKLYEALYLDRPVVCLFPTGSPVPEIVAPLRAVLVADPFSEQAVREALDRLLQLVTADGADSLSRRDQLQFFDRRFQAAQFAALLEG